jgi:hypothetical protein
MIISVVPHDSVISVVVFTLWGHNPAFPDMGNVLNQFNIGCDKHVLLDDEDSIIRNGKVISVGDNNI